MFELLTDNSIPFSRAIFFAKGLANTLPPGAAGEGTGGEAGVAGGGGDGADGVGGGGGGGAAAAAGGFS